jgi:hypothetical protein
MTPEMLPHNSSVGPGSFAESENEATSNMFALFRMNSPMDMYHLLAGNIELVELYRTVNRQIIDEASPRQRRRYTRLFLRTSEILGDIKQCLQAQQVQIKFRHGWLPRPESMMSLWDFFNLINEASEKPTEAENSRLFFRNYQAPILLLTTENVRHAEKLTLLAAEFVDCVQQSTIAGCMGCRCCCEGDLIFSRLD